MAFAYLVFVFIFSIHRVKSSRPILAQDCQLRLEKAVWYVMQPMMSVKFVLTLIHLKQINIEYFNGVHIVNSHYKKKLAVYVSFEHVPPLFSAHKKFGWSK